LCDRSLFALLTSMIIAHEVPINLVAAIGTEAVVG
jgi:hypothetical protein